MAFDIGGVRINIFGKDNWSPQFKAALSNTKRIGKQFSAVGRKMSVGISAPALVAGGAMFKMAADFEFAMQEVKALTNSTPKAMERLSNKAQELGIQTKFSATEAAEGMALLGRAGWNTEQIMTGTEASLNLAAATNMDLARTAEIVANTMGAFEEPIENVTAVTDVLAAVTASSNINLEQFSESMKDGAAMAHTYGLSVKDAAVMAGFLGNMGIKGTKTGTAFKNIALSIVAPTKGATNAFKELGIATEDAMGNPRQMSDIFVQLSKSMKPLTKGARLMHLKNIFGRIPAAAVNSLVNDMSKAKPKFFELAKALQKTDGWANRMAKTMNTGATGEMRRFKSAIEGLSIAVMNKTGFLSGATKMLEKITSIVRSAAIASPVLMKLGLSLLGIGVIIGPAVIALGMFMSALGTLGLAASTVALGPLAVLLATIGVVTLAVAKFYAYVESDPHIRAQFDQNPFGTLLDWVDITTTDMTVAFNSWVDGIVPSIQAAFRNKMMETPLGKAIVGFSDLAVSSGVTQALSGTPHSVARDNLDAETKAKMEAEDRWRLEAKLKQGTLSPDSPLVKEHGLGKKNSTTRFIFEGLDESKVKVVQEGKQHDVEYANGQIMVGIGAI